MKWLDWLKAKIIHALGGMTRAEAMFPAPIVQVLNYDIQTVRTVTIGYSCFGDPESWCFRTTGYGVRVFAYRQKPEEE